MNSSTLTTQTPWKAILSFTTLVLLGLLLQPLYNTVDTLIVGNFLGEASLAAVDACGALTIAFLALVNGFSAEAGILITQRFGANQRKELRKQASSSFLLLLGMGLLATVLALVISRFSLEHILATPKSLLSLADAYFQVYALGLFFQFGYNIVAALLRGIGHSKATLYFLLVASLANIGLDILFVSYFQMGVSGAAWATNLA
ncbi:MAG: hypothetical protein HDR44_03215 [Allobaculum sp.]|nr:hypothetical protein [Allobaculum sp.]